MKLMRNLLLKLSHIIIKKYGVIPLNMKDKVLFNGMIFEVQSYNLSREYFKSDLEIKLSDCFKWSDKDGKSI